VPNLEWLKPTGDLQYIVLLMGVFFLASKYLPSFIKNKKPKLDEEVADHECHKEAVLSNMDERFAIMEKNQIEIQKTQIEIQASLKSIQKQADRTDERMEGVDRKLDMLLLHMATNQQGVQR
jgi:predicted transcriptional regulator